MKTLFVIVQYYYIYSKSTISSINNIPLSNRILLYSKSTKWLIRGGQQYPIISL